MENSPLFSPSSADDDAAMQAALLASLAEQPSDEPAPAAALEGQASLLAAATPPPAVSTPSTLEAFIAEVAPAAAAAAGLRALALAPRHLTLVKVRGDGHCFFRALAAGLVLGAAWAHGGLAALEAHLDSLPAESAPAIAALRALLGRSSAEAAQALDALNDGRSDAAVAALRGCATAHMLRSAARFAHVAAADGSPSLEAYCARMAQMEPGQGGGKPAPLWWSPAYGGQPEMVALSEALGLRVEVIDMSAAELQTHEVSCAELPATAPRITLLRRGLHFHLLLPAAAEGELVG